MAVLHDLDRVSLAGRPEHGDGRAEELLGGETKLGEIRLVEDFSQGETVDDFHDRRVDSGE